MGATRNIEPLAWQDYLGRRGDHVPARGSPANRDFKTGTARQPLMEAAVAWIILFIAGLLEIVWAFAMKQSEGFTRLWPSLLTLGAMGISFALLSMSMRTLPLGTAYTVWTGIGAVGAFVVGIVVLGESANPLRVVAALLIVAGLVLMKLASPQ
jgi:quaternary ammonium compound-resistance protein SugE